MKMLKMLIAVVAILVLGTLGIAYSGIVDIAATSPHSGLAKWFLSTTARNSIERRARDIEIPDLSDDVLVHAGVNDFNAMCAGCHGAPGRAPSAMGEGLNPPAPDLSRSAARMTPAELFWVTKHGIRMTGMPAWGATHDDNALWPVVALMARLPELDADAYEALIASAEGMGHHAHDLQDEDPGGSEKDNMDHNHDGHDHVH